ncbi:MAG: sel1 repeat family protein [Oscillospiraceae bacterium]|nr:sel1 repeat family protein [Oscillospiraceae bacterium]
MAQKVCYNCGARLANNQVSCKNCGAHQWRKGTDKMGVDKLKELADEEYRQGRLGTSEEHNRHMEKSMFLYSIIAEKIAYMAPKMEAIEPMERCIHMLDYILMQERRASFLGDERRQARYRELMNQITNAKDNLVYERMEKAHATEKANAPKPAPEEAPAPTAPAPAEDVTAPAPAAVAPEQPAPAKPAPAPARDNLDDLVDYAIFTVSEMDEMGSWTFLGKPRTKNYMISMLSFLREIKGQIDTLEQKEREVLLHVMFQVADSYKNGTYPFPQNPDRAIAWHTEASNKGLVLSQLAIGEIYLNGSGGMRAQPEKALEWYQKALDANSSEKVNDYAQAAIEHIKYTMNQQ